MNVSPIENATMVMNGNVLSWLTIDRIGIIIGIVLGVIALFFRCSGWCTAREALRREIRRDFASNDMKDAIKRLRDFHREHGDKIGKEFKKLLILIDSDENTIERKKAKELDDDRRRYVHYFEGIKCITKKFPYGFIKDAVYPGEVELFLLIEPMEKIKAEHTTGDFNKKLFDTFRKMYEKKLKKN